MQAGQIQNFTISKIKIMMDLSDPAKIGKPIALTSSILYNENLTYDGLTEFPYFTPDINYPLEYLHTLDYNERIHFFFNKETFERILNNKAKLNLTDKDEITDDRITKPTFFDYNTQAMIKLIFSTIFPYTNNNYDSYNKLIKESHDYDLTIPNFFRTHRHYSYIKLDSKINTVLQTVQVNDFINNPEYRNLLKSYIKFKEWLDLKKVKIDDDIEKRSEKIKSLIKNKTDRPSGKKQILKELWSLHSLSSDSTRRLEYTSLERENQYIKILYKLLLELFGIANTDAGKIKDDIDTNYSTIAFTPNTDKIHLLELLESIRDKINKPPRNIIIPSSVIDLLKPLLEDSKKNYILKKIKEKYFGDEININTSNEDDVDLKSNFTETNYKQYFDFIKDIKLLITPNLESTNRRLQKMIYNYSQSTDPAFGKYLEYIHNKYLENINETNFPLELYSLLPVFDEYKNTIEILLLLQNIIYLLHKQLNILDGYNPADNSIIKPYITTITTSLKSAIDKSKNIQKNKSISENFSINKADKKTGIIRAIENTLDLIPDSVGLIKTATQNNTDIKLDDLLVELDIIKKLLLDLKTKTVDNTDEIKEEFIKSLKDENYTNHPEILYVGVNSTETISKDTPKYQIVLLIDVAIGEVNDSNNNYIKCKYFSNDLDKRYKLLQNKGKKKWEVGARGFFDIEKNSSKHVEKEKEKELNDFKQTQQKIQNSQKVPITNVKVRQGGYKKTYKKRNLSCKRPLHKLTIHKLTRRKTNKA